MPCECRLERFEFEYQLRSRPRFPNSGDVNQMSKKQEEVAEDLNKTLSLESLIVALQNEDKRSPNTERKLSGLKQELEYKKWCNFSTKEAVAHVPILSDLSPGNSPEH